MESCSNQKSVKQIKMYLISEILQKPPFALMTTLHTLSVLSTSFTWNAFLTVLKEFPHAEHLLAAFPSLCGPTHPKPPPFGWGRGIVEARSSDAALHHSPSLSYNPYTAWSCVGLLSCWKTNDSPTKRKPDGMAYDLQNAMVAMLVKCTLNSK